MKRFLYPCVIYKDDEENNYKVAFHDLGVYTEADTVELTYLRAHLFLQAYCETALKIDADFPEPSGFIELQKKHPKDIVQLVFVEVGDVTANIQKKPIEDLLEDDFDSIESEIIPGKPYKLKEIK